MPTKNIAIIGYGGAGFAQAISALEAQNIEVTLLPDGLPKKSLSEIVEEDKMVQFPISRYDMDVPDMVLRDTGKQRSVIPPFYGKRDKYGFRKKKK